MSNVSDVLLKFYYIRNQYNKKDLPYYYREKSFLSL